MRVSLHSAPANDLVSLAEAKTQLVVNHSDDDALITRLIGAVSSYIDGYFGILGRALITQDWQASASNWKNFRLPMPDVQSIVSVKYFDEDGAEQTLQSAAYDIEYDGDWPYLVFSDKPILQNKDQVVFVVSRHGYGDDASDIPQSIRHAALMLISHYYEHRDAGSALTIKEVPMGFDALVSAYRLVPQF